MPSSHYTFNLFECHQLKSYIFPVTCDLIKNEKKKKTATKFLFQFRWLFATVQLNCSQSNDSVSNEMLTISLANGTHTALGAGAGAAFFSRNADAPTNYYYYTIKGNKNEIGFSYSHHTHITYERTRKWERRLLTHFKEMFILSFSETLSALCKRIWNLTNFIDWKLNINFLVDCIRLLCYEFPHVCVCVCTSSVRIVLQWTLPMGGYSQLG